MCSLNTSLPIDLIILVSLVLSLIIDLIIFDHATDHILARWSSQVWIELILAQDQLLTKMIQVLILKAVAFHKSVCVKRARSFLIGPTFTNDELRLIYDGCWSVLLITICHYLTKEHQGRQPGWTLRFSISHCIILPLVKESPGHHRDFEDYDDGSPRRWRWIPLGE